MTEEIRNNTAEEKEPEKKPDKAEYIRRIHELSAEDQAFMDGYLFAKVTEAAKKGA